MMGLSERHSRGQWARVALAMPMAVFLALPVLALVLGTSGAELAAGVQHHLFAQALWLSTKTTLVSLVLVVMFGTPLAWWLAVTSRPERRVVELVVDLPVVLPPAVVGIALLHTFGRSGIFSGQLTMMGWQIPFTVWAVVMAQVAVSAPLYIQSAQAAFRRVDQDLVLVGRTLGLSAPKAFFQLTVPLALPGLMGGAALAWARALGEFGATLLFAGNLPGTTQTMPLAIYMALESDVRVALALSLVLAGLSVFLLLGLRLMPQMVRGETLR
ncbi:MAG: molybdate ABC transporter permease subunit [Myxococcota bacterium]|nr:molybdate ABC transporter permease subunit [Myxococcota bacterium]